MKHFPAWVVVVMALALPRAASACTVCTGGMSAEQSKGLGLAILGLLVVTYCIVAGIISFVVQFNRRASMIAAQPENQIYKNPDERIHS